MGVTLPPDIADLAAQLDAAEQDARMLIDGLSAELGAWRPAPGAWTVAECFDHLAITHCVYLNAMQEPAVRARSQGLVRRDPAKPGLLGGWFARSLEPPVKPGRRMKAPRSVLPRTAAPLAEAAAAFHESQALVRAYLHANADLDLSRVRFPNPFVRGLRFSLAAGLHVIAAHDRRHLWQAWRIRRVAESAAASGQ